ncbi:hypothetical protein KSF_046470 [Reticulibacter mediterranei]|uniref:Uncharacterized protein n=1 Tax=Reticulibacter mediterranei TaxID=2778369 RepID=A0A8J3N0V6_9CHLR|nr:hypothetical protein KSF_046470 [Reticulibacter mediterranei]
MRASHQIISYQIALPRIPRVSTVSRERVAPVPTMGKTPNSLSPGPCFRKTKGVTSGPLVIERNACGT